MLLYRLLREGVAEALLLLHYCLILRVKAVAAAEMYLQDCPLDCPLISGNFLLKFSNKC
jgi:hypothetical protein